MFNTSELKFKNSEHKFKSTELKFKTFEHNFFIGKDTTFPIYKQEFLQI